MHVKKRVVVADDYPDAAELLAEVISMTSDEHLEMIVCLNGREALDAVRERTTAAVLLDIDMPVMNGVDAAIAIRKNVPAPWPLLVAITGRSDNLAALDALGIFDVVLGKPADVHRLRNLIATTPLRVS